MTALGRRPRGSSAASTRSRSVTSSRTATGRTRFTAGRYEFAAALLDTIAGARVVFLPPVVFLDADEFNQRRTQLEELPANRDLADVLDVDAATVDEYLSDIVRDLTLTNVDDSEMNAHLNEMRKEVAARVRGGDA